MASGRGPWGKAGEGPTHDIGRQDADVINNVLRDQYIQHVQNVYVMREDALGQITRMNRIGRWFATVGFALAGLGVIGFIGSGVLQMTRETDLDLGDPGWFEEQTQLVEFAGIPLLALAMGVALLGFALLIIGAVINMSAHRAGDHLDRDYPLPPAPV